jgi:SecD/SecF fusion protein
VRALRLAAMGWSVATVLLAGAWSTGPVDAQSPPGQKWCLSFHEVHPLLTARDAAQRGVPAGFRIVPAADSRLGDQLLREEPVAHAGDMADAQHGFDACTSQPIVTFRFNATGARKFAMFTRDNVGRPFAIVAGGRVVSAPVIREPILGGQGQISGNLTFPEAEQLASRIRSGTCAEVSALPASIALAG